MWALLPKQSNVTALQAALDAIVRAVGRPRNGVKLFLLTDGRRDKMHKRYIFGIHGGNELEYGFQHFRDGRPVWVSPMPKAKVTEMLSCFVYRKNDYVLEDTFTG